MSIRNHFHRLPTRLLLTYLLAVAISYLWNYILGIATNYVWDFVISTIITQILLFGMAQFALPVSNFKDRRSAWRYLNRFMLGGEGSLLLVKNGKIEPPDGTNNQNLSSQLVWFDSASAGVLRTITRFTKPVGPGLVFLSKGEELKQENTVDLHLQVQRLSRDDHNAQPPSERPSIKPSPFKKPSQVSPSPNGNTKDGNTNLRYFDTHGITRDGIVVVPDIEVVFRLIDHKGSFVFKDGEPHFGYDPESVYQAVVGQPVKDEENSRAEIIPWKEIPIRLAVDVWRECIRRVTLDELFRYKSEESSALQEIVRQVEERLTQSSSKIQDVSDFMPLQNTYVLNREYRILRERGIEVLSVSIENLSFDPRVEQGLVKRWQENWLEQAETRSEQLDHDEADTRSRESLLGLKKYVWESTRTLRKQLSKSEPSVTESCAGIINDLIIMVKNTPSYEVELETEALELQQILSWLQNHPPIQ